MRKDREWQFLTNHAGVLMVLCKDPSKTIRDVALLLQITERAVQRIVAELEEGGYLERTRSGRGNIYTFDFQKMIRDPILKDEPVSILLKLLNQGMI